MQQSGCNAKLERCKEILGMRGQTWVKCEGRRMREGWGGGELATCGTWLGQVHTWHGRGVSKGLGFGEGGASRFSYVLARPKHGLDVGWGWERASMRASKSHVWLTK
ncbi:hypothetical protein PIB30_078010 [Stylosanthes scabra]|uniref:Uncharacterized protein n=1 Tax=Stylosanthes scabra TaxID=79078 RepID=A0ABU6QQ99_9FABA|nr:hypothetical protein [Stylosanthes scabra]